MDAPAQSSFVRSRLPWVVAAAAFILYLVTLNRWVSLNSLMSVSSFLDPKVTPPLKGALFYLVTLPLHLLPASLQLAGLNVFTALCGALTLALLTRSIALLPHDRTREERHRLQGGGPLLNLRFSWAPPLLAAVVLGVQLSFWEHATSCSGEMFNLLLLAYVARCLLEYRQDPRESWLTRLSLVYGMATANSYSMIGYFPLALAAVIWVKGTSFFQLRFLLRMTLWGLAGLLVYLIVPLIMVLQENNPYGYLEILRYEMWLQYQELRLAPRLIALMGALASVVPIFLIAIRWPSTFGDTSAFGNLLINVAFRLVYLVFSAFILWMMLGADFAPRAQIQRMAEGNPVDMAVPAFLSFYYLAALALGYFLGYSLLVFGTPEPQRHRRRSPVPQPIYQVVAALPGLAALGTALFLAWTNAPVVRLNDGQLLKGFAARAVEALPQEPAVVLSDKPKILTLVYTLLRQRQLEDQYLLVNTGGLSNPAYQRDLNQRAPHLWPDYFAGTNVLRRLVSQPELMLELSQIAIQHPTYYLHPSFGFFFERTYLEPHDLVFRMRRWTTNDITPPSPAPDLLQSNNEYFRKLREELTPLTSQAAKESPDARTVARWYSLAFNHWGTALLRHTADQLETSTQLFQDALNLNPGNRSAKINLDFAQARRSGQARSAYEGKPTEQILGKQHRKWENLLSLDGPVDDPAACLSLGRALYDEGRGLPRQASVELRRSLELSQPDRQQEARYALAVACMQQSQVDETLAIARQIHEQNTQYPLPTAQLLDVFCLEADAMRRRDQNLVAAEAYLRGRIAEYPLSQKDAYAITLIDTLGKLYLEEGQAEKALAFVNEQVAKFSETMAGSPVLHQLLISKAVVCRQIQHFDEAEEALDAILNRNANHEPALLLKGVVYIEQSRYSDAISVLDRLVPLQPDNPIPTLNRAIALLKSGNLEGARADYRRLLELLPRDSKHLAHYGLGEIAWQLQERAEARKHYEAYMESVPQAQTQEARNEQREVTTRLESLKSGSL